MTCQFQDVEALPDLCKQDYNKFPTWILSLKMNSIHIPTKSKHAKI